MADIPLAVNGTLMRGLELEPNMQAAGATFVKVASTKPRYRFYSIGDVHPAMERVADDDESGISVKLEVWNVPPAGLGMILQKEPPGLCIGKVELEDGEVVLGVVGEHILCAGGKDISEFGCWHAYTRSLAAE